MSEKIKGKNLSSGQFMFPKFKDFQKMNLL